MLESTTRYVESRAAFEESLAAYREAGLEDTHDAVAALSGIGGTYVREQRHEEGARILGEVLERRGRAFGPAPSEHLAEAIDRLARNSGAAPAVRQSTAPAPPQPAPGRPRPGHGRESSLPAVSGGQNERPPAVPLAAALQWSLAHAQWGKVEPTDLRIEVRAAFRSRRAPLVGLQGALAAAGRRSHRSPEDRPIRAPTQR